MDGNVVAAIAAAIDEPRHQWRRRDLVPTKRKQTVQRSAYGARRKANPRRIFEKYLQKTGKRVVIPNPMKRFNRGQWALRTNAIASAQREIELMLREKGVSWHKYMRELAGVPRHHPDDKRAYWAFRNVIRKHGRNTA